MRFLINISLSAAVLFLSGCNEQNDWFEELEENTEFRLDGTSLDVNSYGVASGSDVDGGLLVMARARAEDCADRSFDEIEYEKAIRADIHILDPAALPLETPILVGDPSAPIRAELSALDFYGDCLFWKGNAQGTVTMHALNPEPTSIYDIRGTLDLRAENAQPDCPDGAPMLIEMRWANFFTSGQQESGFCD